MLQLAIVEDDTATANELRDCTERYCAENNIPVTISVFNDGLDIAEEYRPVWDVILLDIEMPHLDGLETARYIRKTDPGVVLMFITNLAQYAIRGYDVGAIDFVIKPVTYPQLAMKLRRAFENVRQREPHYIVLTANGAKRKLMTESVHYIEVINHQLLIHCDGETYTATGSLQDLEKQLQSKNLPFARCSGSYLVNMRNVTAVHRDSLFLGDTELPITRSRRAEFLRKLSDYAGGGFV